MVEYIVLAVMVGLWFACALCLGLWIGHKLTKITQAPKWFQPPVNTERAQALKERKNEDDYLKGWLDKYNKSLYMSSDDYNKGDKK